MDCSWSSFNAAKEAWLNSHRHHCMWYPYSFLVLLSGQFVNAQPLAATGPLPWPLNLFGAFCTPLWLHSWSMIWVCLWHCCPNFGLHQNHFTQTNHLILLSYTYLHVSFSCCLGAECPYSALIIELLDSDSQALGCRDSLPSRAAPLHF